MIGRRRLLVALVLGLFGCGGGGSDGGADSFVPEVGPQDLGGAEDVPAVPDVPGAPDVPIECTAAEVFVPALGACYPLAGEPDTECVAGGSFVLSFSSFPTFDVTDQPAPVVQWAQLDGTVTATAPGQLVVTGRDGAEYRFEWANHTRFGAPWQTGDAVHVEWIGVENPYDTSPRHGLKVEDAIGRLRFLVDDGKGDLPEPIWTYAPAGGGMEGFAVAREPVGCPVAIDPPGRQGERALPVALRFTHESGGEALVLPGAEATLDAGGQPVTVLNALAERRVGEEETGRERMAWLVLARPPAIPEGQRGGPCGPGDTCADSQCAQWPGGTTKVCL